MPLCFAPCEEDPRIKGELAAFTLGSPELEQMPTAMWRTDLRAFPLLSSTDKALL